MRDLVRLQYRVRLSMYQEEVYSAFLNNRLGLDPTWGWTQPVGRVEAEVAILMRL